jgi:prepilin-type N-terminal cleavage/methylation domain-containing protein
MGPNKKKKCRGRGYTLTELMISLSIFAFASTAMSSLMFATYNTNRHVKGTTDATSQAEIAMRRIIEVTRSASDLQYTNASTGLFVQTPPDSSNLSYIFIYYTSNGQLREKIQTAGSLTLIQDTAIVDAINTFTVTRMNAGSFPESYRVDLVLETTPVPISRSVVITGRNLTQ